MDYVDPDAARKYMELHVQPLFAEMLEALAINQPSNVLQFVKDFADRKLDSSSANLEATSIQKPKCCFSNFDAELKVKTVDGSISYYTEDAYTALRRKNKLRGSVAVALDEEFPDEDENEKHPSEIEWTPVSENAPSVADLENRPVTPPKRGFTMTLPGQNYHEEGSRVGSGSSSSNLSEPAYLSFAPQSLGTVAEGTEGKTELSREELRQQMIRAAKDREETSAKLGSDHLITTEKRRELDEKRRRDDMIGTIMAYYNNMGGSAPFGLPAADNDVLERHYRKCKKEMQRQTLARQEVNENRDKANSIAKALSLKSSESNVSRATADEPRSFKFEPRAFGTSGQDDAGKGTQEPLGAEERRRIAAEAAAKRFAAAS